MALNSQGAGGFYAKVPGLDGALSLLYLSNVVLTQETEDAESVRAFPVSTEGLLVDVETRPGTTTTSLTTTREMIDEHGLDEMFGRTRESQTIALPARGGFSVAAAPAEYAIAGLAADTAMSVTVLETGTTEDVNLTRIPAGGPAPSATEFSVEAGKIVFNDAHLGKTLIYFYLTAAAATSIRGGTSTITEVAEREFIGGIKFSRTGTRMIWAPRCKLTEPAGVDLGADEVEATYQLLTPTGWNAPYVEWKKAA